MFILTDIAERSLEIAGIGGWEYNCATGQRHWTKITFQIHELDASDGTPPSEGLSFYPPEAAARVLAALDLARETGTPWDMELPFVTAKGRHRWVHVRGQAVVENGKITRLLGTVQDITERRAAEREKERLSLVCRQTDSSVLLLDAEGRIEWANAAFTRLSGYDVEAVRGRRPSEILHGSQTSPETAGHIRGCVQRGEGYHVEILNYAADGTPFWVSLNGTPLRNEFGVLTGFISVGTDITARRRAEAAARQEAAERWKTEALLRDVLEALPSAVTVYDSDNHFVLCNRTYEEMFPLTARFSKQGHNLHEAVRLAALAGQYPDAGNTDAEREAWAAACVAQHLTPGESTWVVRTPDGRYVQPRQQRSESGNLVCIRTDATDLVRIQAELRAKVERDPLTEIANREALLGALGQTLKGQREGSDRVGALLLFDLDDFKQVNDSFGHDVGDAVLKTIADRLRAHVRAGDLAARLGGDEFAVLMPGLDTASLQKRMDRIHAALSAPATVGARSLHLSVSAGVTLFPDDGGDCERLLKNADMALYDAKHGGGGRWCRFRPEQARAQARQDRLTHTLRHAIASRAIEVALQPKRRMDGRHAGFEALARWRDEKKFVPPCDFIPLAEQNGLGTSLGRLVMEAALERLASLRGLGLATGSVAVNVTARQLLGPGFLEDTLALLDMHRLLPADLEIELTEAMLLGRAGDRVTRILQSIKASGVTLALDDFGTGIASLVHLSHLQIDRLKIDSSFVAGIGQEGHGGRMTRTVIRLARGLQMETVAEGVETQAQFAFLQAEGCDAVQGYFVAHPMLKLDEAAAYLRGARRQIVEPAD